MDFVELTEKEYQKFWENHPLKTFLSAPKIAKLREKSNWKSYFVGVKENKKVEMALWKIIPPEEGSDFCHRLVYHGRDVCTARTKPYCDKCCLADICKKVNVE